MNEDFKKSEKYFRAKERTKNLKEFYIHVLVYLCVIVFLIVLNFIVTPDYYWFIFPMLGWGTGVFFHGMSVLKPHFILGKKWEEEKIKEYMDKSNF